MRHKKHRNTLGVTKEHRIAMLSNMAASLITHGRVKTTLAKARALRPFVEKLITKAKRASAAAEPKDALHQRRIAHKSLRDEDALTLLFNEKYKEFANRAGGYTRIYKLGARIGDAAEMALIELVKADDPGYKKKKTAKTATAKKAKGEEASPAEEKSAASEEPIAEVTADTAPATSEETSSEKEKAE